MKPIEELTWKKYQPAIRKRIMDRANNQVDIVLANGNIVSCLDYETRAMSGRNEEQNNDSDGHDEVDVPEAPPKVAEQSLIFKVYKGNGCSESEVVEALNLNKKPENYSERTNNLFDIEKITKLSHTISADVKMTAGIAVDFVSKFGRPVVNEQPDVGDVIIQKTESHGPIFHMISKELHHQKPTLAGIMAALITLKRACIEQKITRIAMPKIGCGLDKLNWNDVSKIIQFVFMATSIQVFVCAPSTKALAGKAKQLMPQKNVWMYTIDSTKKTTNSFISVFDDIVIHNGNCGLCKDLYNKKMKGIDQISIHKHEISDVNFSSKMFGAYPRNVVYGLCPEHKAINEEVLQDSGFKTMTVIGKTSDGSYYTIAGQKVNVSEKMPLLEYTEKGDPIINLDSLQNIEDKGRALAALIKSYGEKGRKMNSCGVMFLGHEDLVIMEGMVPDIVKILERFVIKVDHMPPTTFNPLDFSKLDDDDMGFNDDFDDSEIPDQVFVSKESNRVKRSVSPTACELPEIKVTCPEPKSNHALISTIITEKKEVVESYDELKHTVNELAVKIESLRPVLTHVSTQRRKFREHRLESYGDISCNNQCQDSQDEKYLLNLVTFGPEERLQYNGVKFLVNQKIFKNYESCFLYNSAYASWSYIESAMLKTGKPAALNVTGEPVDDEYVQIQAGALLRTLKDMTEDGDDESKLELVTLYASTLQFAISDYYYKNNICKKVKISILESRPSVLRACFV